MLDLPWYCLIKSKPRIVHNIAGVGQEDLVDSPLQALILVVVVELQDLILDCLVQLRELFQQAVRIFLFDQCRLLSHNELSQLNCSGSQQSQSLPRQRTDLVRLAGILVTLPVSLLTARAAV